MIFKKKSLVVAFVSSSIICCVLVLTLVGYVAYMELKDNELKSAYQVLLGKINARIYSGHIDVSGLAISIEDHGPLSGKAVLAGALKNAGFRDVSDVLLRVKLLDTDGAVLYEVVFHPQEPSLGSAGLSQVSIPYLSGPQKPPIKRGETLPFKKILTNCPREIYSELKRVARTANKQEKWSGRIEPEVLSVGF